MPLHWICSLQFCAVCVYMHALTYSYSYNNASASHVFCARVDRCSLLCMCGGGWSDSSTNPSVGRSSSFKLLNSPRCLGCGIGFGLLDGSTEVEYIRCFVGTHYSVHLRANAIVVRECTYTHQTSVLGAMVQRQRGIWRWDDAEHIFLNRKGYSLLLILKIIYMWYSVYLGIKHYSKSTKIQWKWKKYVYMWKIIIAMVIIVSRF